MKAGWELRALGEVCQIKPSKSIARKSLSDRDNVSFVPMGDLGQLEQSFEPVHVKCLGEVYGAYTYFSENDVLVAKITPCFENGKLGIARGLTNGIGFGSSEFVPIRSLSAILPEYVFYFLVRKEFRQVGAKIMTGAVGHKRVPEDYIRHLHIPLPPLAEQRRIVEVLDAAFGGLARASAHTEANLQNARELFDSVLRILFFDNEDWTTETLNSHVRFVDYRGNTPPKTSEGVRLITAKNVKRGFIQRDPEEFMDEAAYEDWMTRGFPEFGDVLFTTEAPLGNVAQLDTDERVVVGQRLINLKSDPAVLDDEFLKFALLSPPMQEEIHRRGTGATVKGIKASLLKTVPLSFPRSLSDQREVARKCRHAFEVKDDTEKLYRAKLADLDDLRQSLLQKAFAGELT